MSYKPLLDKKKAKFTIEIRSKARNEIFKSKREDFLELESKIEEIEKEDDSMLIKLYQMINNSEIQPGLLLLSDFVDASYLICLYFLNFLIDKKKIVQPLIDSNFIHLLMKSYREVLPPIYKLKILRILGLIASSPFCQALMNKNGFSFFHSIFLSSSEAICASPLLPTILWILGNITGDCLENRDQALKNGLFEDLIVFIMKIAESENFLKQSEITFEAKKILNNAVWTLANLCREEPPDFFLETYKGAPIFCKLILQIKNNPELISDSAWALVQLAKIFLTEKLRNCEKSKNIMIDYFIESGSVAVIPTLTGSKNENIILNGIDLLNIFIKHSNVDLIDVLQHSFKETIISKSRIVRRDSINFISSFLFKNGATNDFHKKAEFFNQIFQRFPFEDYKVQHEILRLMKILLLIPIEYIDLKKLLFEPLIYNLSDFCEKSDKSTNKKECSNDEQIKKCDKIEKTEKKERLNSDSLSLMLDIIYLLLDYGSRNAQNNINEMAELLMKSKILETIEDLQYFSDPIGEKSSIILETFFEENE